MSNNTVAWARFNGMSVSINKMYADDIPLYRQHIKQSPLSYERIIEISESHRDDCGFLLFARSIELEHDIK